MEATTKTFTNPYFEKMVHECLHENRQLMRDEANAYWAYRESKENEETEYIVSELGFAREVPGFMRTLEQAGINEFILTDSSTSLMEDLNILIGGGWQVAGTWEKNDGYRTKHGLRMRKA